MSDEIVSAPEQVEEQVVSEIQEENQEVVQEPVQEEVQEVQAETQAELQDEVEKAIEEGASEEEVINMVKQFQLKVNGKEFVKELDLNDEEAVKKELQLAAAGRNAMQEAAELKKAYQQEIDRLKNNPWAVLKELGLDERGLVEDKIHELIEQDKKTPEQLEREQVQKELAEAREKAAKLEKQMEEREAQQLYEQESAKLQDEIKSALDAHTTLHASPKIERMVAAEMEWAMDNGYPEVTADMVLPTVEAKIERELNEMFNDFDESSIEKFIGKGNLDRIRQKKLETVTKSPTSIASLKKESSKETKVETPAEKRQRLDDFMRRR